MNLIEWLTAHHKKILVPVGIIVAGSMVFYSQSCERSSAQGGPPGNFVVDGKTYRVSSPKLSEAVGHLSGFFQSGSRNPFERGHALVWLARFALAKERGYEVSREELTREARRRFLHDPANYGGDFNPHAFKQWTRNHQLSPELYENYLRRYLAYVKMLGLTAAEFEYLNDPRPYIYYPVQSDLLRGSLTEDEVYLLFTRTHQQLRLRYRLFQPADYLTQVKDQEIEKKDVEKKYAEWQKDREQFLENQKKSFAEQQQDKNKKDPLPDFEAQYLAAHPECCLQPCLQLQYFAADFAQAWELQKPAEKELQDYYREHRVRRYMVHQQPELAKKMTDAEKQDRVEKHFLPFRLARELALADLKKQGQHEGLAREALSEFMQYVNLKLGQHLEAKKTPAAFDGRQVLAEYLQINPDQKSPEKIKLMQALLRWGESDLATAQDFQLAQTGAPQETLTGRRSPAYEEAFRGENPRMYRSHFAKVAVASTKDAVWSYLITQYVPARFKTLTEATPEITRQLKEEKARQLAQKEAEKTRKKWQEEPQSIPLETMDEVTSSGTVELSYFLNSGTATPAKEPQPVAAAFLAANPGLGEVAGVYEVKLPPASPPSNKNGTKEQNRLAYVIGVVVSRQLPTREQFEDSASGVVWRRTNERTLAGYQQVRSREILYTRMRYFDELLNPSLSR